MSSLFYKIARYMTKSSLRYRETLFELHELKVEVQVDLGVNGV